MQIDRKWIPYLVSIFWTLIQEQTWASDKDRAIGEAQNLILQLVKMRECPPDNVDTTGIEVSEECDVKLRLCGGRLQICDCGTWVDVPSCDGEDGTPVPPSQPGGGSQQPQPNGGTAHYCGAMSGLQKWLLPTKVNAGDTLLFDSLTGSWNDGVELAWHCPDGWLFVIGSCFEGTVYNGGTDPLMGTRHMEIVAEIAGSFYDVLNVDSLGIPQPFTIPGGISNEQVLLQANVDYGGNIFGEVGFCVEVTNNQAGAWEHTFDFLLSNFGWGPRDMGVYTNLTGFEDGTVTYTPNIFRGADIQKLAFSARDITRVRYTADSTPGAGASNIGISITSPGSYIHTEALVSGVHEYDTGEFSPTSATNVYCDNIVGQQNGADPGGSCVITKVILNGLGVDPF